MKLIIVILSVFLVLGTNAEDSESISSEEIVDLDKMIEPRGFLDDISKCGLCKTAMDYINKKISKDSSKEKIKKTLDKACTVIPIKSVRTKCHESVAKKGDKIAQKVADKATPQTVCKLLELC